MFVLRQVTLLASHLQLKVENSTENYNSALKQFLIKNYLFLPNLEMSFSF